MVKNLLSLFVVTVVLTGCSTDLSKATVDDQKEYILTQLNDYQGLIEISRKKLSANDNDEERFNLSQLYYKTGDYSSSNIYLEPLVIKSKNEKYRLLQAKNHLELGQEEECEKVLNDLLAKDNSNGELWNLKGSLLAQQGKYNEAIKSFERARGLFYNENIVINNLAMMAILQQDYPTARNYLLSLYSRKQYKPQTIYNLVYTLVKMNDYESAKKIIKDERIYSGDVEQLFHALANLSPKEKFNLESQSISIKEPVLSNVIENTTLQKNISEMPMRSQSNVSIVNPQKDEGASAPGACAVEMISGEKVKPFIGKIKNAKEIKNITYTSEDSGGKLTLYSTYPINYIFHPQKYNNQIDWSCSMRNP